MLILRKIAVTGSIASGKSTVCSFFEQWGAYTVDADKILHDAFVRCETLKHSLVALLGNHILEHGILSRKKISDIIFTDEKKRISVESVCHEYAFESIQEHYKTVINENNTNKRHYSLFVAEVPLLFETTVRGFADWFDAIIYIDSTPGNAFQRYIQKGGTDTDFWRRNNRFLPAEMKRERAQYCLVNNGSLIELEQKAKDIFEKCLAAG